jgi:hypothetical protein
MCQNLLLFVVFGIMGYCYLNHDQLVPIFVIDATNQVNVDSGETIPSYKLLTGFYHRPLARRTLCLRKDCMVAVFQARGDVYIGAIHLQLCDCTSYFDVHPW